MTPGPSSQPSSSSIPTQPASAQSNALSPDVLESLGLLARAFSAAAAVSALGTQTVAQPGFTAATAVSSAPPPFVAAPAAVLPPGTSLFDRFPQVEASTILEITRHEFKPMDLFKLDPASQDKNLERKSSVDVEEGVLTATPRGGSLRDYPTFSSLLEPLLVYFNILTAYAASSGDMAATLTIADGSNVYPAHLSSLNRQFQWNAVLQYHKSFFLARRREMARGEYSGWLRPDVVLMSQYVYSHPRIQSHPSSSKSSRLASNSAKQPVAAQICFAYNKGSCTSSPCPNGRIHKCQKCDALDHGALNCSKAA